MYRTALLTTAALLALSFTSGRAEEVAPQPAPEQSAFSQAIHSIKNWFGSEVPQAAPVADTTTAASDDVIQIPPPVGVNAIEPAAGMDPDTLQVPPPYYGPQSDAGAMPRASAFDSNSSITAFGDANATAAAINAVAPAAGEGDMNAAAMDCDAILKAAEKAEEGDVPDAEMIATCKARAANPATDASAPAAPAAPMMEPAQPAFEPSNPLPAPLPATQPAAGEAAPAEMPAPADAPKAQ